MTRTLEPVPNGKDGVDICVDCGERSEQYWFESCQGKPVLTVYFLHQVDERGKVVKTLKHYMMNWANMTHLRLAQEGSKILSRRPSIPEDVLAMASKWLRERRIANLEKALALAKRL